MQIFGLILAAASALSLQPAPNAITLRPASASLVIPAVGNVAGGNGTFFRTDLTLVNHADAARKVALTFIERDRDNTTAVPTYVTLPPRTVLFLDNFVATTLQKSGLGALTIRAVNENNTFDSTGRLDAFARIYTQQPGTSGTVSQPFYAVRADELSSNRTNPAYVIGLKQDAQFRTNIGIVNLDNSAAQSYLINIVGTRRSATMRVDLGVLSMTQVPLPEGDFGDLYLVITPESSLLDPFGDGSYASYGSSVDNTTGDSWSVAGTFGFGR